MKMKHIFSIMCLAAASVLVLGSCAKSGPAFMQGTYGYAVSGSVTCDAVVVDEQDPEPEPEQVTLSMVPEQGIMHIEPLKNGNMVLTTKSLTGSVMVWNVKVDGTDLTLVPALQRLTLTFPRTGIVLSGETTFTRTVEAIVSGKGYKTGGMIVLELNLNGDGFEVTADDQTTEYTVTGTHLRMVANQQ